MPFLASTTCVGIILMYSFSHRLEQLPLEMTDDQAVLVNHVSFKNRIIVCVNSLLNYSMCGIVC